MRKRYVIVTPILALAFLVLNNCQGNNSSEIITSSATIPGASQATPAVITSSAEGADAASTVLQSKELVVTSANIFKDLGFIAQSQMLSAATSTGTGTCADYGTYDYTNIYSNTSEKYTVILTFNLCRQNDFQYDGTYMASGKSDLFTAKLLGLNILNFQNNYATLIGSLVGYSLSYVMQGSGIASNATYTITTNGGMLAFDYYTLGQHTMTFSNLVKKYNVSMDTAANIQTISLTANGIYSVKWTTKKSKLTYSDFKIDIQNQLSNNSEDVSMAGRVAVDNTPDSDFEGVFDVSTTTPIRTVTAPYPPKTTQGTFTINNTAAVQYGASDTIDVTVAGDTTLSYAKEFMLMKQSDFYAMEQQLPIVSGMTGTASGDVMSISALSSGSSTTDLNCYTDVHVKYYSADKLPTPPVVVPDDYLWMVHWDSNLDTCVTTTMISFQEATSTTGVTTDACNVGLDINGAATDITSGGVEHFLAAALPAGYYILSINNYSCSATVTNAATVLVGDYLFGPYTCSYTSSDGDGSVSGAWCRLTDVRVNTDGSINMLAPNLTLTPWH